MGDSRNVRHSEAESASLLTDENDIARREAINALRQTDRIKEIVLSALHGDRPFRLRPSLIQNLNRCAIDGLNAYAGNWRPASVGISGSKHQPPEAHLVAELVEELCDFVNDQWQSNSAVKLSAFALWRINWIHPFSDGNGRTARAVAHVIMCIRLGAFFPGEKTIPEQILQHRDQYYHALEAADTAYSKLGLHPDVVVELEDMLAGMLAAQLKDAYTAATSS